MCRKHSAAFCSWDTCIHLHTSACPISQLISTTVGGISLVVQWLRLHAPNAGALVQYWSGTQYSTCHIVQPKQMNKIKKCYKNI